ncbi:HAD hydrolase family protein [Streptomyces millisiae]|uniref:HAD hydrolase family protein n=1 Tax=Streptomyces millisiae TaxID=3075542 RepID=UPI00374E0864
MPTPSPAPSPALLHARGPAPTVPPIPAGLRPRLIATDLDGTLLREDKTVSPRTVAALAAAEAAGIHVIFVTGRPARWMGPVRDHVPAHGLAICGNGAAVVDLRRGGELVATRPLPLDNALAIVRALRATAPGVAFAVERAGGFHHEPGYAPMVADPASRVAPAEALLSADPAFGGQPVLKLLAHHGDLDPDEFLALGRAVAGEHGEFTRSNPNALLEISGPGVSKASTLAGRCRELGVDQTEVVAFGDMPNDLAMLGWAGTAYAMANAHPAVLAATPHHTLSNDQDGVARVIEGLLS